MASRDHHSCGDDTDREQPDFGLHRLDAEWSDTLSSTNGLLPAFGTLPLLLLPMRRVAAASWNTPETTSPSPPTKRLPLDSNGMPQRLVMGALCSLLALWIRQVIGGAPLRLKGLLPSSAIGGIAGSVGLGLMYQLFSLTVAFPLLIAGCLLLAITASRMTPSAQQP